MNKTIVCFLSDEHRPFEQSREVVLVHALLGDRAKVGGQQRKCDGQQVGFTAQTVVEHPAGDETQKMDLAGSDQKAVITTTSLWSRSIPKRSRGVWSPCVCRSARPSCNGSSSAAGTFQTRPASSSWPIRKEYTHVRTFLLTKELHRKVTHTEKCVQGKTIVNVRKEQ